MAALRLTDPLQPENANVTISQLCHRYDDEDHQDHENHHDHEDHHDHQSPHAEVKAISVS